MLVAAEPRCQDRPERHDRDWPPDNNTVRDFPLGSELVADASKSVAPDSDCVLVHYANEESIGYPPQPAASESHEGKLVGYSHLTQIHSSEPEQVLEPEVPEQMPRSV